MTVRKPNPRQSAGFTLIEVMIAVGILVAVGAATGAYLVHLSKTRYTMEAVGTRDALNLRLRRLTTWEGLRSSATLAADPGNALLRNCIFGGNCTATNLNAPIPFILTNSAGAAVAGSDNQPVLYCHNGQVWSAADNPCRYEWKATAYFTAICPFNAATCALPRYIRVSHKLSNDYLKGEALLLPPGLSSATGGVFTTVEVPQPSFVTPSPCNPHSAVAQISPTGAITCQCLPGFAQTGAVNGQPVCSPQQISCPYGYVATGLSGPASQSCRAYQCSYLGQGSWCNGSTHEVYSNGCQSWDCSGGKKGGTYSCTSCSQGAYVCCY